MKTNKGNTSLQFIFESYRLEKKLKKEKKVYNFFLYALLLMLCIMLVELTASAQSVGINNPTPHSKSLLDLTSSDKGLLTPRLTQAQRIAMFPAPDATAKGMLVYQTDNTQGFYYYDGTAWQLVNSNAGWGLTGNAGTASATNFIGTTDNQPIALRTNNVERMRIDANGNFGIDTIVPQARMHVKSNSSVAWPNLLVEERDSADFSRISFKNKGSNKFWTTAARSEQVDSQSFYNIYNSSTYNLLTVRGDGNVGLGWGDPMYPLTFKSTLGDKISFWGGYGGHYGIGIQPYLLQIHSGSALDDIAFGYGSSAAFTERMRIKGSGNVGIGISNPSTRLQVVNNDSAWQTVSLRNNHASGWSGIWFMNSSGAFQGHYGYGNATAPRWANQVFAGSITAIPFVLTTADVERMRIDETGRVGIGNTSPQHKLDIAGNINLANDTNNLRINGIRVFSTKGASNLFAGEFAGVNNSGTGNTFIGDSSGFSNTSASANTAVGMNALKSNTTGQWNTAVGRAVLEQNTTGFSNTGMGIGTLTYNTTGYRNTAIGGGGLQNNTTGIENTAMGYYALRENKTANFNVAVGAYSLFVDSLGESNTAVGHLAGNATTSGDNNVFIGKSAGSINTTGNNNLAIGFNSQIGSALVNATAIGSNASATTNNSFVLGGTGVNAVNVGIGTTAPQHKLSFGNDLGSKISFWQGATTNYGIGLQGALLQFYTASVNDDHAFGYGSSTAFTETMRIKGNGDVGIGTATPTATLEVNGYTKLGSNAPAVKMIKFSGNTSASSPGSINFAHGLNQAKILSVSVMVQSTNGDFYPPNFSTSSGANFSFAVTSTQIYIYNISGNSGNITNRPYRVLITYEE